MTGGEAQPEPGLLPRTINHPRRPMAAGQECQRSGVSVQAPRARPLAFATTTRRGVMLSVAKHLRRAERGRGKRKRVLRAGGVGAALVAAPGRPQGPPLRVWDLLRPRESSPRRSRAAPTGLGPTLRPAVAHERSSGPPLRVWDLLVSMRCDSAAAGAASTGVGPTRLLSATRTAYGRAHVSPSAPWLAAPSTEAVEGGTRLGPGT